MRMGKILLAVLAVGLMASTANADLYVWFTANQQGAEGTAPIVEVNKGDIIRIEAWCHGVADATGWTGDWNTFGGDVLGPGLTMLSWAPATNINADFTTARVGVEDADPGTPLLIDDVGGARPYTERFAASDIVQLFYFDIEITSDFAPSDLIVLGMEGSNGDPRFSQYYPGYGVLSTGFAYFGADVTVREQHTNVYGYHDMITLHVLPEPATLVLLGFGALALIRRR